MQFLRFFFLFVWPLLVAPQAQMTIWQWWNEWISKEQKYNVSDIHWRRGANGKPIPMMRWLKNSVDLHERTHRGVFYHCTHHYIYWEAKLRPQSVDISQSSSCVQKCFQQQERSLSRFFTWCVWWQKKLSNCCKKKTTCFHCFIFAVTLAKSLKVRLFFFIPSQFLKNIFNFITSVLESLLSRWGWQNWSWAIGRKHELCWSWKTANNGLASPGQQGGEPDPSPGHGPASPGQGGPDGKENLHFLHQEPR